LGQPFDETYDQDPKRWQTPTGTFTVVEKRKNPVWRVPKSIQEEMAAEGKTVYEQMPPGPENPLGHFWIGLSRWGYGIHGTIAPTTVGRYKTHGCIRMKPGHIDQVFAAVQLGSVVRIVYEPVKVATFGQQVWLEVDPDTYDQIPDMGARVQARLAAAGVAGRVDPARVSRVLRNQWGVAVRVDRDAPPLVTPTAPPSPPPLAVPTPEH
ncbi:MAG TPA: L,D-transpeptidase, partial [Stenomitos sp.]